MQCPLCGYQLSDFDSECPKCHGKGIPKPAVAPPQSPPPYNPTIPRPAPEPPRRGMSPVVIGALILVPVVAAFAALNFFGMEIKPKGGNAPTAVPTSVPVADPTTATALVSPTGSPVIGPTVAPSTSKISPRPQSAPVSIGAPAFGKNQTFGGYSRDTLALIDAITDPRQLSRIGLDLYSMSADSNREKERAQVRGDGAASQMWNYASSLFDSLGDGAAEKVKFLDGRTFPEAYRAGAKGRGYACAQYARAADAQLDYIRPKTQQEQQNSQVLKSMQATINRKSGIQ